MDGLLHLGGVLTGLREGNLRLRSLDLSSQLLNLLLKFVLAHKELPQLAEHVERQKEPAHVEPPVRAVVKHRAVPEREEREQTTCNEFGLVLLLGSEGGLVRLV